MTKNSIPDGWLPFSPVGKLVSGTRFIAFKVPLKEAVGLKVAPKQRFSPAMLIEMQPKLSLIIDLTNTTRYYDRTEFTEHGIDYEKIKCPGKLVPPPDIVQQFFDVVDKFMSTYKSDDNLIGVHCTHGVNRTGYFICKYMIQKLGIKPSDAIASFQRARGHEIERSNYIASLQVSKRRTNARDGKRPKNNPHHVAEYISHRASHNQRAMPKVNWLSRGSNEHGSQLNYYDDELSYSNHTSRYRGHSNSKKSRFQRNMENRPMTRSRVIRPEATWGHIAKERDTGGPDFEQDDRANAQTRKRRLENQPRGRKGKMSRWNTDGDQAGGS